MGNLRVDRRYESAFKSLGRPLRRRDGTPEREILQAERRLGVRAPVALRSFYRLAGRAHDFVSAFDELLPPADWFLSSGKIVFMAENQAVVVYGVDAETRPRANPPVFLAANGYDEQQWYETCPSCTGFLEAMLLWQCAYGDALPKTGTAKASPRVRRLLDEAWVFAGEVNRMRAYRRAGRAVCYLKWSDGWRVFCAAASDARLERIFRELKADRD